MPLSDEMLLEMGHQHKLIKYSFAGGGVIAFGRAVAEAAIKDLQVNAMFEDVGKEVIASQYVSVKRTEMQDDGSLTAIIDYWPMNRSFKGEITGEAAEILSDLLCLIDNNLKFGCVPMAYVRAKALYRILAANKEEVRNVNG